MAGATSHRSESENKDMTTRAQRVENLIRHYMDTTGETDVDMVKLAAFAHRMGWPLPVPKTPLELLAKQLSHDARETVRHDKATGRPYRAYHAYSEGHGDKQLTLWIDIDRNPPRHKMHKSLNQRREQMVGDAVQLAFDAEHWNHANSKQEPIQIEFDFGPDIEWRKNAPPSDDAAQV